MTSSSTASCNFILPATNLFLDQIQLGNKQQDRVVHCKICARWPNSQVHSLRSNNDQLVRSYLNLISGKQYYLQA